jgi:DNA polymerase-3 subunit alpha
MMWAPPLFEHGMSVSFVHLRAHTTYSLSQSALRIEDLVSWCKKQKMPAIGITETGNLFSLLEVSIALSKGGIQTIAGCVLTLPLTELPNTHYQLALYAQNARGMHNLLALVSEACQASPGTKPIVSLDILARYTEGILCLSGGVHGASAVSLLASKPELAASYMEKFSNIFPGRFYLELTRHGTNEEKRTESALLQLAYTKNVPIVATNHVFFSEPGMYKAHDALLCIANSTYVATDDRQTSNPNFYLKSPAEMAALFADLPEALANSVHIAKRCAIKAEEREPHLPRFPTDTGLSEEEELYNQAHAGLNERLSQIPEADEQAYRQRLDFELDVITRMQYAGYFLIVSDFMRWAKRQGIPVGPGRGSGAGSAVAWSLLITDLDPIRFGLLFERFLNPERVSMPDFDIDFCQERRDEVIQYVQEKYGADHVAQIITFGKLQARAVLRDVGRVLQMPYPHVDRISKMVPNNPASPVTLSQALELEPALEQVYQEDEQVKELIDIALQLEGLNRHASTHAAGVVIADRPLQEVVPLYYDGRSPLPVVQYSMKYAEAAGLVKFDFLGLKTLTMIQNCLALIQARTKEHIDISQIPLDDAATYAMLSRGDAIGVFQFEGKGMRDALRKLKPDCIEDLIALGALYRPGPMDNIPTYIARKHGLEQPDYLHPSLEVVLKETFGVIIYQEQVMEIAQILAGYSLGGADLLRRAMGKKIKAEMDAQRAIFLKGATQKGVSAEQAGSIFDLVAKFAGYGFNKSHAAAYAIISYQTAYLKANYPVEFLTATMNLEIDDTDKLRLFRDECRTMEVAVLSPDINHSHAIFTVEEHQGKLAIRYGLGALKNVGVQAMNALVAEREKNGAFINFLDVVRHCDTKILSKRQLESLVKAGAFDAIDPHRAKLFASIESTIRFMANARQANSTQISLFSAEAAPSHYADPLSDKIPSWTVQERLLHEHDAIGYYLSEHPLSLYYQWLHDPQLMLYGDILERAPEGNSVARLLGSVIEAKTRASQRGRYAFVQLSDPSGSYDVAIFNEDLLRRCYDHLVPHAAMLVQVEIQKDQGSARLVAQQFIPLATHLQQKRLKARLQVRSFDEIEAIKTHCRPMQNDHLSVEIVVTPEGMPSLLVTLPSYYSLSPFDLLGLGYHTKAVTLIPATS